MKVIFFCFTVIMLAIIFFCCCFTTVVLKCANLWKNIFIDKQKKACQARICKIRTIQNGWRRVREGDPIISLAQEATKGHNQVLLLHYTAVISAYPEVRYLNSEQEIDVVYLQRIPETAYSSEPCFSPYQLMIKFNLKFWHIKKFNKNKK